MKNAKRILAVVLVMVMALTALPLTASAGIADTAKAIKSGSTYNYTFPESGDYVDYKFTSAASGTLTVKMDASISNLGLRLYDSNFNQVKVSDYSVTTGTLDNGGAGETAIFYYYNNVGEKITSTTKWKIGKGTYYLRVNNDNGRSGIYWSYGGGKVKMTATYPTTSGKISYLSLTLNKGDSIQLGAVVTLTDSAVKWKSSKKSVATVSSSGKVTAKGKGSAIITAKCGSSSMKIKIIVK